jgi:hypothetical protein
MFSRILSTLHFYDEGAFIDSSRAAALSRYAKNGHFSSAAGLPGLSPATVTNDRFMLTPRERVGRLLLPALAALSHSQGYLLDANDPLIWNPV